MMRHYIRLGVIVLLATSMSGCGLRGSLKSPTQIAYQKEKDERRAAKKAAKKTPTVMEAPTVQDEGVALPDNPEPGALQYDDILDPGAHPNQPSTHGTYQ